MRLIETILNRIAPIRRKVLRELKKIKLAWPELNYSDQRAYLNRMLRLALPFFRRRNILRENASSNARYPGLAGYAIHAAPARSIWISRSLLTVTHFLGRTAAKSWVSPKTGAPAPPPPRPPSPPPVALDHRHHRQCCEDAVAGIQFHRHSGEQPWRGAALPSGAWVAFSDNQWAVQPIDFTGLAVTVYFYTILPATLNATFCSNTPAGPIQGSHP